MSVAERLSRLLFIVPYVAHRDGVPVEELAEKLHVSARQIEADIDLLSLVGQPPLTPDHLIDLYIEDNVVYVELDQSLSRPLRLTHEEARALVLAVKLVGNMGGLGPSLERVLEKIVEHLNPVDQAMLRVLTQRVAVWRGNTLLEGPAALLREAIEECIEVVVDYYSASSDRQKTYTLKPLALLTHTGSEYLVALDGEREKLFRLDRIGAVHKGKKAFKRPESFDLEKFRTQRLYFGQDILSAEVRFPAHMAAGVLERFTESEMVRERDGTVRVRLSTSSAAWLVRWVLAFGCDAEVVAPKEQRQYLAEFCAKAASVYAS